MTVKRRKQPSDLTLLETFSRDELGWARSPQAPLAFTYNSTRAGDLEYVTNSAIIPTKRELAECAHVRYWVCSLGLPNMFSYGRSLTLAKIRAANALRRLK